MADLNLNTVELTSTLRTAPLNGSPSSSDFNEGQRETLVDLASLSGFINNILLPLLNALPAGALLPVQSPVGVEGRTIWTDTSDQSTLFFDSLSSAPLTVADTIRVLNGILTVMRQQLTDQGVEVASLQARLASTNQNDIALALQNLSASLNQLSINQQIQNIQITEIQGAKIVFIRSDLTTVPAGTTQDISMTFALPYSDDLYSISATVEFPSGPSGLVSVGSFVKDGAGLGVTVSVINHDIVDVDVIVHILASHD